MAQSSNLRSLYKVSHHDLVKSYITEISFGRKDRNCMFSHFGIRCRICELTFVYIPGVPKKAERSIFITLKFGNIEYFYFIR